MRVITKDDMEKMFYVVNERVGPFLQLRVPSQRHSKRKNLVMTVSITKPTFIQFYILKASDKEELRQTLVCSTNNLKKLDCRDSKTQPTYDFQIVTDKKTWSFTAAKLEAKHHFLVEVCRIIFLLQPTTYTKIKMANFPDDLTFHCPNDEEPTLESVLNPDSAAARGAEELLQGKKASTTADAYRSLTPREEQDVCEFLQEQERNGLHLSETEMTESLQEQLANLEGVNINSIVSSEVQSRMLMTNLDKVIQLAEDLEKEVNGQNDLLVNVKDAMSRLLDRDQLAQVCANNWDRLLASISDVVSRYNLDPKYVKVLEDVDLSSAPSKGLCMEAAKALDGLLKIELSEGEMHMRALSEGRAYLESLSDRFAVKLASRVNDAINQFAMHLKKQHKDNKLGHFSNQRTQDSKDNLLHLAPLVGSWLQSNQKYTFTKVKLSYIDVMRPVYARQIEELVRTAHDSVVSVSKGKKNVDSGGHTLEASVSASQSSLIAVSSPVVSALKQVDSICSTLLNSVAGILTGEESFITQLFRFHTSVKIRSVQDSTAVLDTAAGCMQQLFEGVRQSLTDYLITCIKIHPTLVLPMFVSFSRFTATITATAANSATGARASGDGVSVVMLQTLQIVRQLFKKYIEDLIISFRCDRPSKKSQTGPPPMVSRYIKFIDITNEIFDRGTSIADLEQAHKDLLRSLNHEVERVAGESVKTPAEVVQLESYHQLQDGIRKVKICDLKEFQQEVCNRYTRALEEYTMNRMGQPLGKFAAFFDSINELLDRGIRPDVIQYRSASSKQALAKVISEYPGKEVKRGLEVLCKKVEKHLSKDCNLFGVVWYNIQEKFFKQLDFFNELIAKCYPDSGIKIAFTTQDLVAYFTEISESR